MCLVLVWHAAGKRMSSLWERGVGSLLVSAARNVCLATPRVVGSPNNDIYGFYGEQNYINVLYLVGYSPLKITDIFIMSYLH